MRFLMGMLLALAVTTAAHAQRFIETGSAIRAPEGWTHFCLFNSIDCHPTEKTPEKVSLTRARWTLIEKINREVNSQVRWVSDKAQWNVDEVWSYPVNGVGDCEDYVLEKRRRLFYAGLPLSVLLITYTRDLNGDGHAVLTVVTNKGEFILDNQTAKVLLWEKSPYRFVKRQSREHPNVWVSLHDTRDIVGGTSVHFKTSR